MTYINESIKKFMDDLSAKLPAPGGGSAAALVGAVAASLNCMVANFTVGNEKYKNFEEEVKNLLNESAKLRDELMNLIQSDIDAYSLVSKAYKMSKDTEIEKENRTKTIEEATRKASEVPYNIIVKCYRVLLLCNPLLIKGNKNLLSDVGVSALLALSSMKAAFLNVKINFFYLKDEKYKYKILKEINQILKESEAIEREVLGVCNEKF